MQNKLEQLKERLVELESVVLGYSGGVDSVFLAKVAFDTLGDKALAVIGQSPSLAVAEYDEAKKVAEDIGIKLVALKTEEFNVPGYRENSPNRCFYCKSELFEKLKEVAKFREFKAVIDGTNASDLGGHRPGKFAAQELQVFSPLAEVGLTKDEIRELSGELGLPTKDRPSMPCLASRIAYGVEVTMDRVKQVERVEATLKEIGILGGRARHHDTILRIETDDLEKVMENREKILETAKEAGFTYITLDLQGYRSGSLNEVVDPQILKSKPFIVEPLEKKKTAKPKEPKFKPKSFGEGIYTLYIDGCSKGNPGDAAFAGVLFDYQGKEVFRILEAIGKTTNNVAEYSALICSLNAIAKEGYKKVAVLSDSELVVKQVKGEYRVKNAGLKPLYNQAKEAVRQFEKFQIIAVPRKLNAMADFLANEALRVSKEGERRESIPSQLEE